MIEHHHYIIPPLSLLSTHFEVSIESPGVSLQLEGGEDEFVERTAVPVYQVEQFSVVSPGLQVASKKTEGRVLVNLNPELEVLPQPHHVRRVARPPHHPHPHPGGRGGVGHHVGACRLERNPAINHFIV